MDNNKDKDLRGKEDIFTDDLREALRRREAKRPQTEMPVDFLGSVMRQVESEKTHAKAKTWRIALASLAIAACTITAVLLVWPKGDGQNPAESKLIVHKETFHQPSSDLHPVSKVTVSAPENVHKAKRQVPRQRPAQTQNNDKLDDYIAELENGLADVRDSCYLAQVERMIANNEDLQRLMNEMTNQKQ